MDPVTTAAATVRLGNAATSALATTTRGVKAAVRRLRLAGIYDPKLLNLGVTETGDDFTATEAEQVHLFLRSPRVQPLLSFAALVSLTPEAGLTPSLKSDLKATFLDEAKRWNIEHDTKWNDRAAGVWARVQDLYAGVLPDPEAVAEVSDELAHYSQFVATPLAAQTKDSGATQRYVSRLATLAGDLDRLSATYDIANQVATQIALAEQEPILAHAAHTEHHAEFAKLYVKRTFVDTDTDEQYDSDLFVCSGSPYRIVLLGSPGAGKTTFVKHLVASTTDRARRDPPMATLVLRCRDYVAKSWSESIADYLSHSVAAHLSVPLTRERLEDVLLVGQAAIIFDGLDEVTDPVQRAEMVQRIHSFITQYPPVSVLVTSREVGYQRAPLSNGLFHHLRLHEFSDEQTLDYCQRWFDLTKRPDLVESFLAESDSVSDLRRNPLLLSLLCVLYREHGAIPSNRRDIYAQCAQELFHRWDSHRQIKQHESMPKYGDRIMQEIARWFYTTPSAQGGLEEQLIAKVIANYMVTPLGFQREDAEPTARDFLAFCAERAWLLGTVGTNASEQRLFRFTHRTFYEYFAAEAFAREASTTDDICQKILDSYGQDPTSVLPELLIQAHDASRDRGAAEVFSRLCQLRVDTELLLRLMEGAILPDYARAECFDLILRRWTGHRTPFSSTTSDPVTAESFTALLSMNALARRHFTDSYLLPPANSAARECLLRGWASLELAGHSARFSAAWRPIITQLADIYESEFEHTTDACLANWLAASGRPFPQLSEDWQFLVCNGVYGVAPGALWWELQTIFGHGDQLVPSQARDAVRRRLLATLTDTGTLPYQVVRRLSDALAAVGAEFLTWRPIEAPPGSTERGCRALLTLLILALAESDALPQALAYAVAPSWPGSLMALLTARATITSDGGAPNALGSTGSEPISPDLPLRCTDWATGRTDLVGYPQE